MHIKKEDIYKTIFHTPYGHYGFIVVNFGLTNALTTFMCFMNNIFHKYLDKFVLVFLDDIMVYSHNEKEHKEHLQLVLHVLWEK